MSLSPIKESAQSVLKLEAQSLLQAAERMGQEFEDAVNSIIKCNGKVVICGMGKSGHIARKVAATLSSTGTPSMFLHPSEALHGDLGIVDQEDCFIAIAQGGETKEVIDVGRYIKRLGVTFIAITGKKTSSLSQLADIVLDSSVEKEACPLNLAPTCSSTLALALGDALAVSLMKTRGISQEDFAKFHPAGSLGRRLRKVQDIMISADSIPFAHEHDTIDVVLQKIMDPNYGILSIQNESGHLVGCITDGDIKRSVLANAQDFASLKASDIMSSRPKTILPEKLALEALRQMETNHITALFVAEPKDGDAESVIGIVRMFDILERDRL